MKAPLPFVLMACAIGHSLPTLAQMSADPPRSPQLLLRPAAGADQPTAARLLATGAIQRDAASANRQPAETSLTGARHSTPTGPGRVKEVAGTLISDPARAEIRLEATGRAVFVVPYSRINAMHYEEGKYPRRFLARSSHYLTLHYADAAGRPTFETIRLLSEHDALLTLAALEHDTGSTVDRSRATQSFLGIPIRARLGDRVAVTDRAGKTTKGVIARLSALSLTLDESTGASRVFDEASLQRIRLLYSPKHDALVSLGTGAAIGAFTVGSVAAGFGGSAADVLAGGALGAGIFGGGFALSTVTIGALHYPFNPAFDVYRSDVRTPTRPPATASVPKGARAHTGVFVSVRF